jgi:protein TonB
VNFHTADDKKHHVKALIVSIVAHVSVFLIILSVSNRVIQTNKPIVIDFSIEESEGEGVKSSAYKTAMHENKRGSTVHKGDVKGNKTEVGKKEMAVEESKSVSQPSTPIDRSVNIETEAPVLIPAEGNSQPKSDGDIIAMSASAEASSGSTGGGLFRGEGNTGGMRTGVIGQSGDGSGRGSNGRKIRYLKENFSYIRDMIQKKVVYPKIARQNGWQGKVTVSFIIFADGFAKDIEIIKTSGVKVLDSSAAVAVKDASPFPKPPCEAQIIIPLVYKLN